MFETDNATIRRPGIVRERIPSRRSIRPILGFKVHKMRDSLPWTPMNRRMLPQQYLFACKLVNGSNYDIPLQYDKNSLTYQRR